MQRALIEVVLVGLVCGLVGPFVVLRGMALMGDALSHTVFPGVVLSYIWGRSVVVGAFIFGVLTAVAIGLISRSRRVSEDSAVGVLFVAFFAFGVLLLSRETGFRRDLDSLLFGNVLAVSWNDVWVTLLVSAIVCALVLLFLKEITLVAFDPTLARSHGYPVFALDLGLLVLVAATIVVSLQTVGNILILALLVTPAATARLLTDRLHRMMAVAAVLGVAAGVAGLFIAYHADVAAGASIVVTATAFFVIAVVFGPRHGLLGSRLLARRGEHHVHHYHPHDEPVQ